MPKRKSKFRYHPWPKKFPRRMRVPWSAEYRKLSAKDKAAVRRYIKKLGAKH